MTFLQGIRRLGLVDDFTYSKLDLSCFSAYTIRPQNFKNGYWSYNLDSQLERLRLIAKSKEKTPEIGIRSPTQPQAAL